MFSRILKLQICKNFHEILLSCSSSTYKVDVFDSNQSVVDLTVDLIKKKLNRPQKTRKFFVKILGSGFVKTCDELIRGGAHVGADTADRVRLHVIVGRPRGHRGG